MPSRITQDQQALYGFAGKSIPSACKSKIQTGNEQNRIVLDVLTTDMEKKERERRELIDMLERDSQSSILHCTKASTHVSRTNATTASTRTDVGMNPRGDSSSPSSSSFQTSVTVSNSKNCHNNDLNSGIHSRCTYCGIGCDTTESAVTRDTCDNTKLRIICDACDLSLDEIEKTEVRKREEIRGGHIIKIFGPVTVFEESESIDVNLDREIEEIEAQRREDILEGHMTKMFGPAKGIEEIEETEAQRREEILEGHMLKIFGPVTVYEDRGSLDHDREIQEIEETEAQRREDILEGHMTKIFGPVREIVEKGPLHSHALLPPTRRSQHTKSRLLYLASFVVDCSFTILIGWMLSTILL